MSTKKGGVNMAVLIVALILAAINLPDVIRYYVDYYRQ